MRSQKHWSTHVKTGLNWENGNYKVKHKSTKSDLIKRHLTWHYMKADLITLTNQIIISQVIATPLH